MKRLIYIIYNMKLFIFAYVVMLRVNIVRLVHVTDDLGDQKQIFLCFCDCISVSVTLMAGDVK